jgi:hypothetical protein
MAASWTSLYFPCEDSTPLATALQESLTALGYTLYNPFGILPGKAYPQSVRLFVSPPVNGWTRVIGEPDARQLPALSKHWLCLSIVLDGREAQIDVYVNGEQAEPETAFIPYLRDGRTSSDLNKALYSAALNLVETEQTSQPQMLVVPVDDLPEDVRDMAGQVNPAQAQKLFERLSGSLMQKVSPGENVADEAQAMLAGGNAPDWNNAGGQRIRALMACLTVPDDWREPDFVTLRDAYQLHARRQRKPDARLYPGDAEAMQRVPNALDYTPVYGGR